MKVRVSGLIELVLAFAVALAIRNMRSPAPWVAKGGSLEGRLYTWTLIFGFGGFLRGLGLMGSLGLYVERIRKRCPPVWGLGRWTWSLMIPILLFPLLQHSVSELLFGKGVKALLVLPDVEKTFGIESMFNSFPSAHLTVLFACLVATRTAGLPRDPAPDAREWAGRAYALLLGTWWVYCRSIPM
jgi:hypothetical protein